MAFQHHLESVFLHPVTLSQCDSFCGGKPLRKVVVYGSVQLIELFVVVTSSIKRLANDVFIAPLQKKEFMQRWTGRVAFEDMKIDELSEFYILSATSPNGTRHEAIVKIVSTGMPSNREQEIYKGIIKTKPDFFRFLELMLTDTPLQYISSEILLKEIGAKGAENKEGMAFPSLYEKMLKIAATNPKQIHEIGRLVSKLSDDVVPPAFVKMYKLFVSALN